MIDADLSELDVLAADLSQAGISAGFKVARVVEEWGQDVETQAREWAPRKRLPHYARTITHDVTVVGSAVVGEVGPDKQVNGQASLAHIFEYGTSDLAPRAHVGPAHDRAIPGTVRKLEKLGGDIL